MLGTQAECVEKALEVCRREGSRLGKIARAVIEGTRELDDLAGALAAHHKEPAAWGEWMAAADAVLDARAKEDA